MKLNVCFSWIFSFAKQSCISTIETIEAIFRFDEMAHSNQQHATKLPRTSFDIYIIQNDSLKIQRLVFSIDHFPFLSM